MMKDLTGPRKSRIAVGGTLCLDMMPEPPPGINADNLGSLVEPGSLHIFGPLIAATGGAVANVGIALDKLGFSARLIAEVGNDWLGQATMEILRGHAGSNTELLKHVGVNTTPGIGSSYSTVGCVPAVDRWFHHNPGPAKLFDVSKIPFADLAEDTLIFHLGYPPLMEKMWQNNGHGLEAVFYYARQHGIITSLDMAYPHPTSPAAKANWREIYRKVLPHVGIFLPSFDEIFLTLQPNLTEDKRQEIIQQGLGPILSSLASELISLGTPIVVIKCGQEGLYLCTTNDQKTMAEAGWGNVIDLTEWVGVETFVPSFKVKVNGTTGAGDATIAGWLGTMSMGQGPHWTAKIAAATGASCVECLNATDGIKPYGEIGQRINGWELNHESQVNLGNDWTWDEKAKAWFGPNHKAH
ncbi:MAG: carbohydrate kinase family protein [Patescibacteria group bacterium]